MADKVFPRRQAQTSFQLEVEQLAKIKIIAERFQVSQAQAARWVIDSIDPLVFLPAGRNVSTVDTDRSVAQTTTQS